ncbi:hypothetical protein GOV13_01435 [Candidatus Pacearchaeota archaeon]|nr:hypothetical protein [Candidatus Pacearchaeota archaeon]
MTKIQTAEELGREIEEWEMKMKKSFSRKKISINKSPDILPRMIETAAKNARSLDELEHYSKLIQDYKTLCDSDSQKLGMIACTRAYQGIHRANNTIKSRMEELI